MDVLDGDHARRGRRESTAPYEDTNVKDEDPTRRCVEASTWHRGSEAAKRAGGKNGDARRPRSRRRIFCVVRRQEEIFGVMLRQNAEERLQRGGAQ